MTGRRTGALAVAIYAAIGAAAPALRADDATPTVLAAIDAYNRGDAARAARLLSAEAARGVSDAQVNLGYLYARGEGVPQDQQEALRLYRLAAKKGNAEGMNAIGYKYQYGTGVRPDIEKAVSWYCAAAVRGNPRALNNLAILLNDGTGVPRDVEEARSLWLQAAERGHENAMYNLGISLLADPKRSGAGSAWLGRAAQLGQATAQQKVRALGYRGPLPPPVDTIARMRIQPDEILPGKARICGELVS